VHSVAIMYAQDKSEKKISDVGYTKSAMLRLYHFDTAKFQEALECGDLYEEKDALGRSMYFERTLTKDTNKISTSVSIVHRIVCSQCRSFAIQILRMVIHIYTYIYNYTHIYISLLYAVRSGRRQ
jgi:hypothetical protein